MTEEPSDHPSSNLEEPAAASQISPPPRLDHRLELLRNLGVRPSPQTKGVLSQVRAALHTGLPREAFEVYRRELSVSTEELADVMGIPPRTLARRTERFKPDESERLLRLGIILQKARGILGETDAVRRWMSRPKRALGGLTPLRCCDTEMGAREVENLLGRIEHGVFS